VLFSTLGVVGAIVDEDLWYTDAEATRCADNQLLRSDFWKKVRDSVVEKERWVQEKSWDRFMRFLESTPIGDSLQKRQISDT